MQSSVQIGLKMEAGYCPSLNMNAMWVISVKSYLNKISGEPYHIKHGPCDTWTINDLGGDLGQRTLDEFFFPGQPADEFFSWPT